MGGTRDRNTRGLIPSCSPSPHPATDPYHAAEETIRDDDATLLQPWFSTMSRVDAALLEAHSGAVALEVTDLQTTSRRRRRETVMRRIFFAAAFTSVLVSVLIVFSLARETWNFLDGLMAEDNLGSLWGGIGWFPRRDLYDLRTLLVGSLLVTVVAMVIAFPLGLGAAIYLAEYANPRTRRLLKPVIEVLAGIPSVVLGFFALTVIAPDLVQRLFTDAPQFTVLAAGIGVGILVVPLVASIAEDALRSVPNALREASAGVGARPMTTTLRVVVPAAVSGLVAAAIVAHLAGHRRDDGGGDRRRRNGRCASSPGASPNPARP